MTVARSYIRGPRFALRSTDPAKVRACIRCVYGNGPHAPWCEKLTLADPPPANFNQFCTLDGISDRVHVPAASPDPASPPGREEAKCT